MRFGIQYSKRGILFIALAAVFLIALWRRQGEQDARTLVFCTLIMSNTFLIFLGHGKKETLVTKLSTKPNNVVAGIIIGSIVLLSLALYIPNLRAILHFSFLHPIDIIICMSVTVVSTIFSEKLLEKLNYVV